MACVGFTPTCGSCMRAQFAVSCLRQVHTFHVMHALCSSPCCRCAVAPAAVQLKAPPSEAGDSFMACCQALLAWAAYLRACLHATCTCRIPSAVNDRDGRTGGGSRKAGGRGIQGSLWRMWPNNQGAGAMVVSAGWGPHCVHFERGSSGCPGEPAVTLKRRAAPRAAGRPAARGGT